MNDTRSWSNASHKHENKLARMHWLEIKAAGQKGDWRASEAFLRMSFAADYRRGDINVSATAVNDQRTVVVTEQKRAELQAKLKEIQDSSG